MGWRCGDIVQSLCKKKQNKKKATNSSDHLQSHNLVSERYNYY